MNSENAGMKQNWTIDEEKIVMFYSEMNCDNNENPIGAVFDESKPVDQALGRHIIYAEGTITD